MQNILLPIVVFLVLGGLMGALLAVASKVFAVQKNEKAEAIADCLPGANCGGCGYSGCAALSEAIADGKAPVNACTVGGQEVAEKVAVIMGVDPGVTIKMRAQVMCSGTSQYAKKKYIYEGIPDCAAASRIGGGDKLCPNGCIGLGDLAWHPVPLMRFTWWKAWRRSITRNGHGCGICVTACPKQIIKLIPFDAHHWVGCSSVDDGKTTRKYCDVGCISCKICERNCPADAIHVSDHVASISYDKCVSCNACAHKCPRKIIWSGEAQGTLGLIIKRAE